MNFTLIEENIKFILNQKITPEELNHFISKLVFKKVYKNEYVFKQGDFPKFVAFINTGIYKFYYTTDRKEHIKKIYLPNEWASDYGAFLRRTPYTTNLKALEDGEVFLLPYEDMQKGMDDFKVFERFGRLIAEFVFLELDDRTRQLISRSPKERYQTFMERNPEVVKRVPLKYIASILGIMPESLSRIRRRVANAQKGN